MSVYGRDFAEVYSKFGYSEFSARVAELLPKVLARLHAKPRKILDMTCGEGSLATRHVENLAGFRVQSSEDLREEFRDAGAELAVSEFRIHFGEVAPVDAHDSPGSVCSSVP